MRAFAAGDGEVRVGGSEGFAIEQQMNMRARRAQLPGESGNVLSSVQVSADRQLPALVGVNSMWRKRSRESSPQELSPVVSAECASLTPAKMLSRIGEATGTQAAPDADGEFQSQS